MQAALLTGLRSQLMRASIAVATYPGVVGGVMRKEQGPPDAFGPRHRSVQQSCTRTLMCNISAVHMLSVRYWCDSSFGL